MSMEKEVLKIFLTYNHTILNRNTAGISHEESLMSPPAGGNCINWIVGHLLVSRDNLKKELRLPVSCSENMSARYKRGSKNISSADAENFLSLIDLFNQTQQVILHAISEIQPDQETMKTITGFAFHESYHIGQIGIMRRVLGKEGTIK